MFAIIAMTSPLIVFLDPSHPFGCVREAAVECTLCQRGGGSFTVIDDPRIKLLLLKFVAKNNDAVLRLTEENLPGVNLDHALVQAELAIKNGLLDASSADASGSKVGHYLDPGGFLVWPVVTESGRAYLRMRAPFWWVSYAFESNGFWSGIGAVLVIPVSIILLIIRGILIALRVKFILPG